MNFNRTAYLILILIALMFINACEEQAPTEHEVTFSINTPSQSSGRISSDPHQLVVSIESEDGKGILEDELINIFSSQGQYLSNPIVLAGGAYRLTKFLVLDANQEVIYATPQASSVLSNLVDSPLPISFNVGTQSTSNIELEVIATNSIDPADLGYSSISFHINPTTDILVSFLKNKDNNDGYTFVSGQLTVLSESKEIDQRSIGDSINIVKIRSDYDSLSFEAVVNNEVITKLVRAEDFSKYRTSPLEFVFGKNVSDSTDLSSGLLAHYKLNNNFQDETGNYHGTVANTSTTPTAANGRKDGAFAFDGDDYINLGTSSDFMLGTYSEFTIATWVHIDSVTQGAIISKYLAPSDYRYWGLSFKQDTTGYFLFSYSNDGTANGITRAYYTTDSQGWKHIVATGNDTEIKIYADGQLIDTQSITGNGPNYYSESETLIGAVQFSNKLYDSGFTGIIDDIKVYTRELSAAEVLHLYNH